MKSEESFFNPSLKQLIRRLALRSRSLCLRTQKYVQPIHKIESAVLNSVCFAQLKGSDDELLQQLFFMLGSPFLLNSFRGLPFFPFINGSSLSLNFPAFPIELDIELTNCVWSDCQCKERWTSIDFIDLRTWGPSCWFCPGIPPIPSWLLRPDRSSAILSSSFSS